MQIHAISGQELTLCIPKSPVRPNECVWDGLKYCFEIFSQQNYVLVKNSL